MEARTIEGLERVLTVDARATPQQRRQLRRSLTVRTRLLDAWLSFRPWAVWLLPLASLGIVLTLSSSVPVAGLFAAVWALGFGALLAELHTRFNAARQARRRGEG